MLDVNHFTCQYVHINAAKVIELHIKGAIGPATVDYIERNLDTAQNADLILITLDTPGGLMSQRGT